MKNYPLGRSSLALAAVSTMLQSTITSGYSSVESSSEEPDPTVATDENLNQELIAAEEARREAKKQKKLAFRLKQRGL